MAPVISAKNVWKLFGQSPESYLRSMPEGRSFDEIRADGYIAGVKDVSVDVTEGEMLVIMGLSGSGKSTLVRCFSRLHDITGGTIEVEGQDIMSLAEKDLIDLRRSKMGMVFQSFGLLPHRTVLENVVMDPETRELDFFDNTLAENSRGAYPISAIENASLTGRCGQPKNLIMLTCDAFGVMPPIAKLTPAQAMYHFLSGYTAKVAGTEKGVTEPTATFSTCFGGPFMPRHPSVYGNLLRDLINKYDVTCWLVSTGWTGGPHGVGNRMPIKATRTLLNAALDGSLKDAEYRADDTFGFMVPTSLEGVDAKILDPRSTWSDGGAYDEQAAKLAQMFLDNFSQYETHVDSDVLASAPKVKVTA